MSEQPNEDQELDQGVDLSRRKLAKIGAAAPVIMTLASKPVFGAQCLSQMMSGNMSQTGPGSCVYGWSPGGWFTPSEGNIAGYSDAIAAWADIFNDQYAYGIPPNVINNGTKCKDYTGGVLFNTVFPTGSAIPMRETFCPPPGVHKPTYGGAKLSHWVAAYLNSVAVPGYILTTQQVLDFWNNPTPPPGFGSMTDFFDSTWPDHTPHGSP